jgi:tRNA 2-selenouridine synthase SelU
LTYAQKRAGGENVLRAYTFFAHTPQSTSKCLILLGLEDCPRNGQSDETLDFQGLAGHRGQFSTKLSTENLNGHQIPEKSSTYRQFREKH